VSPRVAARRRSRDSGEVFTVRAADDRYVLFEAEEQGFVLPAACRMGCCTACAVKVKSGHLSQPQALGLSAGLKAQGYALLCVAYADSDAEVELQDPDEVYDMQFGDAFAALATDKRAPSILRDDFALEIAAGDE
jgi:ferredoxin